MSSLHNILKNSREGLGYTTRVLSEITAIDQALISKFENGKRIPTKEQVQLLAEVLNIDFETLLKEWYKLKLLSTIDFNTQSIQAITEILHQKGYELNTDAKQHKIADILSEIEILKSKLSNL